MPVMKNVIVMMIIIGPFLDKLQAWQEPPACVSYEDNCQNLMTNECLSRVADVICNEELASPVHGVTKYCCLDLLCNYHNPECIYNYLVVDLQKHNPCNISDINKIKARAFQLWDYCFHI